MGGSEAAGLGFNPIAKAKIGIQSDEKQPVSPARRQNAGPALEDDWWVVFRCRTYLPRKPLRPAGRTNKKGHLFPGALFDSIQNDQATDGASSAVMSITTGSSSGTSTKAFTLMFRCKSKPVPAGMMWPMMTFSLKPRR